MKRSMTQLRLRQGNAAYADSGGTSRECASLGFRPAFLDFSTFTIHLSRFANGCLAPLHVLDGLPADIRAKATLVSGFERGGFFYTRAAAARALLEWGA